MAERKEIIIAENRNFEGVWIPKRLYITNKFNLRTKFFLVEIKSLSRNGYCFATDKHFSEFLGVSDRMVQTMIRQLKDDDYLTTEYEYEKETRAIKRRFLILTQKFFDEFYNEEEFKPTEKKFDTPTEINFNTGTEKKYGEKYNNNLSDTDSSITEITEKVDTSDKSDAKVYTSSSKKSLPVPERKKTKSELMELEKDMVKRFSDIGHQYDVSERALGNINKAFRRYIERYSERTGKVHPILKDETLENIFVTMATVSDTRYGHFENVADCEPDENGLSYLDEIVDEHFDTEHGEETDYHITHFANREYLEKMANHVVNW